MVETLEKVGELVIPEVGNQEAFNLARWAEVMDDPDLARVEGRVETDRYGNILMTPPPGFSHSTHQTEIILKLSALLPDGETRAECPISTSAGVRAADVVWISKERLKKSLKGEILTIAPEICVEVISPRNRRDEMEEKKRLYFEAGAEEVWICDLKGRLAVILKESPDAIGKSGICAEVPDRVG